MERELGMFYYWIIEGALAQGPLPPLSAAGSLARTFDAVVVLTMEGEHGPLYLERLRGSGVEVLHIPTPDFHPVDIISLARAVSFIDKRVRERRRVLVHCKGGIGRSGLVTSAYLTYAWGDAYRALRHVRSIVRGAVENKWQALALEDFADFLEGIGRDRLGDFVEFIEGIEDSWGIRHLSKVIQFVAEISRAVLERGEALESIRVASSHFHDKGLASRARSLLGLNEAVYEKHAEFIDFAHSLDLASRMSAVALDVERRAGDINITVLCSSACDNAPQRVGGRGLLGYRALILTASYFDYI